MKEIFLFGLFTLIASCQALEEKDDKKIIGGVAATEPVPYQVSLQVFNYQTKKYYHFCGGSIISEKHILTAAHCLDNGLDKQNITVVLGTLDLGDIQKRYSLEKIEIHEKYDGVGANDIGIITLSETLIFSDTINKIDFNDDIIPPNRTCILTGWGYISPIREQYLPNFVISSLQLFPNKLQTVQLKTISTKECQQSYPFFDLKTELCTYKWSKGACVGDSGGPLVNAERNLQIGIVSFGSPNCGGFVGSADVFTRVSSFTTWIMEKIK